MKSRFLILFTVMLSAPPPMMAQAKDASPAAAAKQKQMEEDRQRLYQLAAELKAELEKAGTNTLSVAAVKKTQEIEKLAKSLKERVK